MRLRTVGIYIHIPFCRHRCGYCDFVRFTYSADLLDDYLGALYKEVRTRAQERWMRSSVVDTVYVGGGTPNVLPPSQFSQLVTVLKETFCFSDTVEFSMELNPELVSRSLLRHLASCGVSRLSIGVQSFDGRLLRLLGRLHGEDAARKAVREAVDMGVFAVNVDLIYGLPDQTVEGVLRDVRTAVSEGVQHLSLYALELHEGTPLGRAVKQGRLFLPPDSMVAEMFEEAGKFLEEEGFEHYEISNFARPGFRCRHNIKYWLFRPYVGFGVSAASLVNGWWSRNTDDLNAYISTVRKGKRPVAESLRPDALHRMSERLIFGLRMLDGVDVEVLRRRYPSCGSWLTEKVNELMERGMLVVEGGKVCLSKEYLLRANAVWSELLP